MKGSTPLLFSVSMAFFCLLIFGRGTQGEGGVPWLLKELDVNDFVRWGTLGRRCPVAPEVAGGERLHSYGVMGQQR